MLTMLYMLLDGVVGMEISLVGYAVCTGAYFLFCFLCKANRKRKKHIVLGWLSCEILCDLLWYLIFYRNGDYVNYGVGGTAVLLLLPAAYFLTAVLLTLLHDEKR